MLVLASDHGGFGLKETLKEYLESRNLQVEDMGTLDADQSVDYPDFAAQVAEKVGNNPGSEGILICGTGIGMSIAANKFPGIRAALVHDRFTARMAREHNNANILVMGGRVLETDAALEMVQTWLDSKFEGDRHQRRLDKIAQLEK